MYDKEQRMHTIVFLKSATEYTQETKRLSCKTTPKKVLFETISFGKHTEWDAKLF